jgi:hypothetical protein
MGNDRSVKDKQTSKFCVGIKRARQISPDMMMTTVTEKIPKKTNDNHPTATPLLKIVKILRFKTI